MQTKLIQKEKARTSIASSKENKKAVYSNSVLFFGAGLLVASLLNSSKESETEVFSPEERIYILNDHCKIVICNEDLYPELKAPDYFSRSKSIGFIHLCSHGKWDVFNILAYPDGSISIYRPLGVSHIAIPLPASKPRSSAPRPDLQKVKQEAAHILAGRAGFHLVASALADKLYELEGELNG